MMWLWVWWDVGRSYVRDARIWLARRIPCWVVGHVPAGPRGCLTGRRCIICSKWLKL